MHCVKKVTDDLYWIGGSDRRLALFENVYPIPRGVSYNSYVLLDEKTVLLDTVDASISGLFFENLEYVLNGRTLDYLIVNHMEPDHCAVIGDVVRRYPDVKLVCNAKTVPMLKQFFNFPVEDRTVIVKEMDTLCTGKHTFAFVMAPMVHWPEAMVSYDTVDKILFSADGFGTFGAINGNLFADEVNFERDWLDDARRYFINIVGKYGPSVQGLLKKASALDISVIAPLHGPVIDKDFDFYIDKYMRWSSYQPEEKGTVIAYSTLHGNTRKAALKLGDDLKKLSDEPVVVYDLSRDDCAKAVADSFRFDKLVLAGVTYDGGLMPCMEDFIYHLKMKNYQNRKAAVIENGSWGPVAGKLMTDALASFKNMNVCETKVTIKTRLNAKNESELSDLAKWLLN